MMMEAAKVRLSVAACLFLAWIGWLGYLVLQTRNPVILARPQFLVADLWVLAYLDDKGDRPDPQAAIRTVLWSAAKKDEGLAGNVISVLDLPFAGKAQGWAGAGLYLLPLTKEGKNPVYHLTPLPPAPGFNPATITIRLDSARNKKDEVADLIVELTGLDLGSAKEKVKKMGSDIVKNVPPGEAKEMEKKFKDLDAIVFLKAEELRIYRATPEALEQLKEIRMK